MIAIATREEYDFCKSRGHEPLADRHFDVDIHLRVALQREMFGNGNHESNNIKFYAWAWAHKGNICEECMRPLRNYSAVHVSHILTRGAFPEMAYDVRNVNILCARCHNEWENGYRQRMRIYRSNQVTIDELRKEYEKLRRTSEAVDKA